MVWIQKNLLLAQSYYTGNTTIWIPKRKHSHQHHNGPTPNTHVHAQQRKISRSNSKSKTHMKQFWKPIPKHPLEPIPTFSIEITSTIQSCTPSHTNKEIINTIPSTATSQSPHELEQTITHHPSIQERAWLLQVKLFGQHSLSILVPLHNEIL